MNRTCSPLRLVVTALDRPKFVMLVGLVVALMIFAPCALQRLGGLRAVHVETNEHRSEFETNVRLDASVHLARSARCKRAPTDNLQSIPQAAETTASLRRAVAESRACVPPVVEWSASMRC